MFRWIAPNDGTYLFNTFDSNFDTVLYLREGDCVGAEVTCNRQAFGSIRMDTCPFSPQFKLSLRLAKNSPSSWILRARRRPSCSRHHRAGSSMSGR